MATQALTRGRSRVSVRGTMVVTGQSVDVKQPFVVAPAHDSALQAHVGVPTLAITAGCGSARNARMRPGSEVVGMH
jgi:hypothetical protein